MLIRGGRVVAERVAQDLVCGTLRTVEVPGTTITIFKFG